MGLVNLDTYTQRSSPIHGWDTRWKLVCLMGLMFAYAAVQHLALIPLVLSTTALLYGLSRLPLGFLLARLRYPGLFILAVVLVLPFATGDTVIWQWGSFALRQEGLQAMLLVICRFLAILTTGFILLGTTPFLTLIKAMRSLGLPMILADMTLLSYRYLHTVGDTLSTMQQSMRLRGFGYQRQGWLRLDLRLVRQLASLMGTLLIRSYERSERIYKAMRLRGYGQTKTPIVAVQFQSQTVSSYIMTVTTIMIAIGIVVSERVLSAS